MADLSDIDSAQSVKIIGSNSTGVETNPVNADASGNVFAVVNNASGASAVNIQDGGNSITVDGTITANAGTNLNTSLLALDSTVAKDASLTTINTSINTLLKPASTLAAVTSITNAVTVKADTPANQVNALKVDGSAVTQPISAASLPLPVGASTAANQTGANTSLTSIDGKLGVGTATPTLAAQGLITRPIPYEPATYSAATMGFLTAALATDVFRIIGSATKTVRVKKMTFSGRTTSGSPVACIIKVLKYSTANTGAIVAATSVPHNSTSAAATAAAGNYLVNPVLGTLVGGIESRSITFQATGLVESLVFTFPTPIVLNGVAEELSINMNGTTITGSSVSCDVTWEEV